MLWAVHIADNVLWPSWWLTGLGLCGLLAVAGAWRIKDEEIPRVALLTAAFFVASLIHIRVGAGSVHLLLNGLMGVVLGLRAALAIPLAVFLQCILFGHGGFSTVGINSVIMTIPALGAAGIYAALRRTRFFDSTPWPRALVAALSSFVGTLSLVFVAVLLATNPLRAGFLNWSLADGAPREIVLDPALALTFHPITLALAALMALFLVWCARPWRHTTHFTVGFLLGEWTVLATLALHYLVLLAGGEENWTIPAGIVVALHLPLAVFEGIVLGFALGWLVRVKPEMIGLDRLQGSHADVVETCRRPRPADLAGIAGHGGSGSSASP
jgi:cobalt/nickel transport system permease protein